MNICPSCGGKLGEECFNPEECAWITQDMARRAYESSNEAFRRDFRGDWPDSPPEQNEKARAFLEARPNTIEERITKAEGVLLCMRVTLSFVESGVKPPAKYDIAALALELEQCAFAIRSKVEHQNASVRTMDVDSILDGTCFSSGCFSKGEAWNSIVESAKAAKALGQEYIQISTSTIMRNKNTSTGLVGAENDGPDNHPCDDWK
jgi:hypothetical protein